MENLITFITENWEAITAVAVGIHATAIAIVNLTPTPKDDEFLGKAYRFVEALAGIFTRTAKELPGENTQRN